MLATPPVLDVAATPTREHFRIAPQPGPQVAALRSNADILIYGGAAGSGKTWSLLLEPLRHCGNPRFGAVIFRKSYTQVTNEGGLWSKSREIYPMMGARPRTSDLQWVFPSGVQIKFAHLGHENSIYNWQGSEIPLILWDELTHFSENSFFYMLSRNRSLCGVHPYVRATVNPDADSWVAQFIDWWIGEDGFPRFDRSGVLRYFVRHEGMIEWADHPDDLRDKFGATYLPRSVTFIPARITDNQALLRVNPEYLGNLQSLPLIERARLLDGNWRIRPTAGTIFNRSWFEIVDAAPAGGRIVRFTDLAATERQQYKPDPDYTASVKMKKVDGVYYILDATEEQIGPAQTDRTMLYRASQDGRYVAQRWEIEGGASGVRDNAHLIKLFDGYDARGVRPDGDKLMRAKPLAAQAEAGNVKLVAGAWNERLLHHLHGQPQLAHDDLMDASSGAYTYLARGEAAKGQDSVSMQSF